MLKLLLILGVPVIGTCVAAIYVTTPDREPVVLEFISHSGATAGRLMHVECYADGIETCLRAAGAELCGEAQFEIIESQPLTYDRKGQPQMSYRCFKTVSTVL